MFKSLSSTGAGDAKTITSFDDIMKKFGWKYVLLTLCYSPIYLREREGEEEAGSGDPTSFAMAHLKAEL